MTALSHHPEHPLLNAFVTRLEGLVSTSTESEKNLLEQADLALRDLLVNGDWLAPAWRVAAQDSYRQYPIHVDPKGRFSLVSFVWGPGHKTPIHDHTTWGIIGVLQGAELCTEYAQSSAAAPLLPSGSHVLKHGDTDWVSPAVGDIHLVSNAMHDSVTISIHVYGKDIGTTARHVYDPSTGEAKRFVSGYSPIGHL